MSEPIQYDNSGRMKYHPEYHARHCKPWTTTEQKYLIENYESQGAVRVAMALERTVATVADKACKLRKQGLMPKRR